MPCPACEGLKGRSLSCPDDGTGVIRATKIRSQLPDLQLLGVVSVQAE